MNKTWLIVLAAVSLVLMLWLGREEPPTPEPTAHREAPAARPEPPAAPPEYAPRWRGSGPVYTQPAPESGAVMHFRPLSEKEKQRMAEHAPGPAPSYTYTPLAPDQGAQTSPYYTQRPGVVGPQYRFRPLEPSRERYTGDFPQYRPPVVSTPAWPAEQGVRRQVYGYQPPSSAQNRWPNSAAR
jgi:hypothetical protein